jgi:hypothetical protein
MGEDVTQAPVTNIINHFVWLLDESGSMNRHRAAVIEFVDGEITRLAARSRDVDQETRITVYTFNSYNGTRCLIYDKDVLRVPSIANLYHPNFQTPLIDATMLVINDTLLTATKYGDHTFWLNAITDGIENVHPERSPMLRNLVNQVLATDTWTVTAFVPNHQGHELAARYGFPDDNIRIWDPTSAEGVREVAVAMATAADSYYTMRSAGVKSTRRLFADVVTAKAVQAKLIPITKGSYTFTPVPGTADDKTRIDEFCQQHFGTYTPGMGYYEFTKTETIQPTKNIAVLVGDDLYMGTKAAMRSLLSLPASNQDLRVNPSTQAHTIFVQSTSMNRNLLGGTRLLVFR